MRRTGLLIGPILAWALLAPLAAFGAPQTYDYTITHSRYGRIGVYDRTFFQDGETTRAQSHLRITVKILGIVMHREIADQTEVWRGPRLMSFDSLTTTNGQPMKVSGAAHDNRFVINTPTGVVTAPADVAPTDPWGFTRMGRSEVVSIRSGKVDSVTVTGGESDPVMIQGVRQPARCYHVSTAAQPDKWEVWLDPQGVPIKFRSLEHGDQVDFTLNGPPPKTGAPPRPLAMAAPTPTPDGH